MRVLLFTLVLALALAGCGHKGPLYLPKPKPEAAQNPAPPAAVRPDERERPGETVK